MATIKDLAEYTKISTSTISRYLNNGYVSKEKREIIEEAIKKFDYQGNAVARSLKLNKTNTIALLIPSITNYFFSEFAEILQTELSKKNYKLLLYATRNDLKIEKEYINNVKSQKVDGLIVATGNKKLIEQYESLNIPVIAIDRMLSNKFYTILPNNEEAIYSLAKHLYDNGAKNYIFITTNDIHAIPAKEREQGFIKFAKKYKINYQIIDENIFLTSNINFDTVDAIMVWNDQTAFMVANYLNQKNIEVGKDVMLTGYDDSVFSKYTNPGITTARQSIDKIVDKTVEILINEIENPSLNNNLEKTIILKNPIIYRKSTKKG